MKCVNCGLENREGAKFCKGCGNKPGLLCPACGRGCDPDSKFCDECGHELGVSLPSKPPRKDPPTEDPLARVRRFLPEGLAEKILHQRGKIEGERKQVTVLFCDMVAFTPLAAKLDPEEAYALMDQVYEILIHKVHDYEGTVNELTGDGVMALFGAPLAIEDAPQRAIRSALAIHREMVRFNDEMKQTRPDIPQLRMRVGIHTGPVVVGTLGSDLRLEFKAVGDTVNLASRMEGLAEPGTTYVTGETFTLAEGLFRFERLGEKAIKGKEEPVLVYRVIAPSSRRTRFDVSAERGLTPFVGRKRELEFLLGALERARQGQGQAVSIVSDPGVGKSRLLYEFRKAVAHENVAFLEGKCLSYGRGVAYHPVVDILKGHFDVREADGDQAIRAKVRQGLEDLQVDPESTQPYLLELLSVKGSGIDAIPMSPEARKARTIEALNRIVLRGAENLPLILAVEDLHWIDKSSADALNDVLEHIAGGRVLLLLTYRTGHPQTWGSRSYHSQVTLNPLANDEILAMVGHLLGPESIAPKLSELILEKTEGVPFFVEEFVTSMRDPRIAQGRGNTHFLSGEPGEWAIPSTIQDLILARVDALPETAKEVIQTGSVIEREFSYDLIRRVTKLPESDLLSQLAILKEAELVYERGVFPDSTYIFRHALIREVLYDSLLTSRKKAIHLRVGTAMEALHKRNVGETCAILAEHYFAGENYGKAAEYLKLAARESEEKASFDESVEYATRRVFALEKLAETRDVEKELIDARTVLGLYCLQLNHHVSAKEAVDPIIDRTLELGYKRRSAQIYIIIGSYNFMIEEDYQRAFDNFEKALKISNELEDILSLWMTNYWFGLALCMYCRFDEAVHYWEKALEINVATNTIWGISALKSIMSILAYTWRGRITDGFKESSQALQLAEESGDIFSKAFAHSAHGISCYYKGSIGEAEQHLLRGTAFCETTNLFLAGSLAYQFLGQISFERGEYQSAVEFYDKGVQLCERGKVGKSMLNVLKIDSARARAVQSESDVDLDVVFRYEAESRQKLNKGFMARCIAEILYHVDDRRIDEVESWLKKAIETNGENGMTWMLGSDYVFGAELFQRRGEHAKAEESLNKAIAIFRECGADGWVTATEGKLRQLGGAS